MSRSAFTDCLNFGNPEKPEIGWELAESIEGMAQACEALSLPIVSGNVSLYNDTDGRSIHPTPVVGCVGLVPDVRRVPGGLEARARVMLASAGNAGLPRIRAPGAVRHRLRHAADTGSSGPSGVDRVRHRRGTALLSRARRLRWWPRDCGRGGCAALGRRRPARPSRRSANAVRRGLRPGDPGAAGRPGRDRSARIQRQPFRRIGEVGGDEILGVSLDDLRAVWEREH